MRREGERQSEREIEICEKAAKKPVYKVGGVDLNGTQKVSHETRGQTDRQAEREGQRVGGRGTDREEMDNYSN